MSINTHSPIEEDDLDVPDFMKSDQPAVSLAKPHLALVADNTLTLTQTIEPARAADSALAVVKPTEVNIKDPDGDRPFVPEWVRTAEGRAVARRRATKRSRRAARRWMTRQSTERGHAAQIARGLRRTHEWVIGHHGIHLQATKHAAHTATRDARAAARRARWTATPKAREQARGHAEKQLVAAQAAALAHKAARKEIANGRLMRGATAYGLPAIVDIIGFAESGWLGAAGILATLGTAAFIGRKPLRAESWDPERRSLGDGDPMTEPMLNRALAEAGITANGSEVRLVYPCTADGEFAYRTVLDLPPGATVDKARGKQVELAAALGVDRSWLDLQQAGGEQRLALWASVTDPFANTRPSPLVGHCSKIDTWRDGIPIGFDKRGNLIYVTISDYSMVFGGATRSGKGMGVANILAGAMLDPRVRIRLFDGKGTGEYVQHARNLATFVRRNPRRLRDFLRVLVAEMHRRADILAELGLSKATDDLLEKLGGIELLVIDELATYTASKGRSKEYAEEIEESLAELAAVGAACGIVLLLATQLPVVDIISSRLRSNCAGRWAMRTESPEASNVILGNGMTGQGYDSSKIPNSKDTRGRGWLTTPDTGVIDVRSLFINEATGEIRRVIAAGYELRKAAGTVPGQFADPVEAEMLRLTGASSAAGGRNGNGAIVRGTILDHLLSAVEATGRGAITNAETFAALADVDGQYARIEGEAETTWMSRAGKAFKAQLASLGIELEMARVTAADGSRPNGYVLAAVKAAADEARNARN